MDGLEHAVTDRAPTVPPPALRVRRRLAPLGVEEAVVAALLLLAILARRPGYVLSQTFWLDESWVVDSVRAPLGQLRLVTSPTPVGFTLLLRAVRRWAGQSATGCCRSPSALPRSCRRGCLGAGWAASAGSGRPWPP